MNKLGIIVAVLLFIGIIFFYNRSPNISPAQFNWDDSHMSTTLKDTMEHYLSTFPDGAQVAMAIIDGFDVDIIGLKRESGQFNPVTNKDNSFEIGSITKTFTTALLLKLEADGILNSTDLLKNHLDITLNPGDNDPNDIQLIHLANHTSGFPRLPNNIMKDVIVYEDDPYHKYTSERLMAFLKDELTLAAPAGKKYVYSNLGVGLLGHVISKKLGRPYEELLLSEVCRPLSLNHTTFEIGNEPQLIKGMDGFGNSVSNWNFDVLAGCGALKSSLADMITYTQILMSDSTYLSKGLQPTFTINPKLDIGLAWHISKKGDQKIYWHNGGTGGYTSCLAFDPLSKKAVITLTNMSALARQGAQTDKCTFAIFNQF